MLWRPSDTIIIFVLVLEWSSNKLCKPAKTVFTARREIGIIPEPSYQIKDIEIHSVTITFTGFKINKLIIAHFDSLLDFFSNTANFFKTHFPFYAIQRINPLLN